MKKINIKAAGLKVAGTGAGAYAAIKLNKIGFIGNLSPLMKGLAKIAVGALLPVLTKQKPGSIVEHAGNGMIAIGALEAASKFDTSISVAGLGELPSLGQVYYDEAYTAGVGASATLGKDDVLSYE